MSRVVLDASALLTLLNQETGAEVVEQQLVRSIISAVNASEVMTVLADIGMPIEDASQLISELVTKIIPFDHVQAGIAADLKEITKPYGLSLGDRACCALAKHYDLPVLTADRVWRKLDGIALTIQLLR